MRLKKGLALSLTGLLALVSPSSLNCVRETETHIEIMAELGGREYIPWQKLNAEKMPKTLEEIAAYQKASIKQSFEIGYRQKGSGVNISLEYQNELWKSAKRTNEDGFGDCEEYAINAAYFLEKQGFPPKLMHFYEQENQSGHVIALIDTKKLPDAILGCSRTLTLNSRVLDKKTAAGIKYGYFDNGELGLPILDSIDDVAGEVSKKHVEGGDILHPWKKYKIIDLRGVKCDWREGGENLWKYFQPLIKGKR